MIIDCPTCGAALMFDPESGKMKCEACGNLFELYELADDFQTRGEKELNSSEQNLNKNPRPFFNPYRDFDYPVYDHTDVSENTDYNNPEEMMECRIYTCTSCGAEIAVNDNEAFDLLFLLRSADSCIFPYCFPEKTGIHYSVFRKQR